MNANKIAVRWKHWMLMRLASLHACDNLLRCSSCAATCMPGTYSPHAAISSSSDLLQANVLFRNFPYRTVDLLSIEFHPWLHLAVKENRQKSNVHRAHSDSYAIFSIRAPKGHCVGTILFHAKIKRPFIWFYVVRSGRGMDVLKHDPFETLKSSL